MFTNQTIEKRVPCRRVPIFAPIRHFFDLSAYHIRRRVKENAVFHHSRPLPQRRDNGTGTHGNNLFALCYGFVFAFVIVLFSILGYERPSPQNHSRMLARSASHCSLIFHLRLPPASATGSGGNLRPIEGYRLLCLPVFPSSTVSHTPCSVASFACSFSQNMGKGHPLHYSFASHKNFVFAGALKKGNGHPAPFSCA